MAIVQVNLEFIPNTQGGRLTSEKPEAAAVAPTFYSTHTSLYGSRAKELPPLPRQRADVNIPHNYAQTLSGDNFIIHADNKMTIFTMTSNLQHLSRADTFYCDGTFSISPSIYNQLYTIHAMVNHKMFPLIYGLLPDKKQPTYHRFLSIIKQKSADQNIHLQPAFAFTDFESAAQNAIKDVFQWQLKGCLFHFRQAIWRKVQKYGLQKRFVTDPEVTNFVGITSALPLVRPEDIDEWIEGPGRQMWNHFHTVSSKTTNHVEGWHARLGKLGQKHPNIYRFIGIIRKEQSYTETTILQMVHGGKQAPKKKKYRHTDDEIQCMSHLVGL
ncbi:uncharacterized protein [Haliotis asinina]|uniref:uncharacterized protein n=1 Tax=Haliotis asinina TaxID=109174 RepID=UPI003531F631